MQKLPSKEQMIAFERRIVGIYEKGEIPHPVHFSFGAEDHMLKIFQNIHERDWVFSGHRPHYAALLKGMPEQDLEDRIRRGDSMHIYSRELKIFTSAICAGVAPIAVGVAKTIQLRGGNEHVWVFIGDGSTDEGSFFPAYRYVVNWNLPLTWVIEDNGLSVSTPTSERFKQLDFKENEHLMICQYKREFPHVGSGKSIVFM